MNSLEYAIEKSLIATILFSHHQKEDEPYFNSVELKEESFKDPFHRLVVKQINHNKSLGLSIQDEFITEAMGQNGTLKPQMIELIATTPFSRHNFETYLQTLKSVSLRKHWEI